jgi:hypothetical protein
MTRLFSATDIDRIGFGVLHRTLPKPEWTHAAHLAAAFWLVDRSGDNAAREMPAMIRAYNEATGVANTDRSGYHETITLASLRAVHAWLDDRARLTLNESLTEMLASDYGRSDWLLAYWSRPVLLSVAARRSWVNPDLKPLPF